jgi:peroxiredoxin
MKIKKLFLCFFISFLIIVLGMVILSCSILRPVKTTTVNSQGSGESAGNTVPGSINQGATGYANNFTLYDLNKNKISLSDYQGKIVVLNFFASWCPPCQQEASDFVETYQIYGPKGVQFVGVADDDPTALMKFINDKKIDYPVLLEGSGEKIMPKWGVNAIPTTFILNRNGEILFSNVGLLTKDQLITAIEKALNS